MLRRKIEHLLKKLKYEKLGYSRNELAEQKVFFFLFQIVFIFAFSKNMNPRLYILFLFDKSMT